MDLMEEDPLSALKICPFTKFSYSARNIKPGLEMHGKYADSGYK